MSHPPDSAKKKLSGPRVIGLTGGFGSGKSTVLEEFKRLGAVTADADEISRRVVRKGGAAHAPVVRLLGKGCLGPDGELDRALVASRVFTVPTLLRKLEKAVHPLVRREMETLVAKTRRGVVVLDIPLLFESRMVDLVDRVVVVWAPEKVRLARLLKSGRFARADILRRFRAQMPLSKKRNLADDVIDNGGSAARTKIQVCNIYKRFTTC